MSFKTRHHLTQILTYATLSVMAVGGSLYLYWSFQSTKVLDIKNAPVPVRPQEINPEATVILHYNYCKRSDVHGVVTGAIVSSSTKILLPDADEITPRTCKEFDVPVIIPGQTTDGVYHLEYTATLSQSTLSKTVSEKLAISRVYR
jgi:isopentenyl phosphate kinase